MLCITNTGDKKYVVSKLRGLTQVIAVCSHTTVYTIFIQNKSFRCAVVLKILLVFSKHSTVMETISYNDTKYFFIKWYQANSIVGKFSGDRHDNLSNMI